MHLQGTNAQHRLTQETLRERAAQVNAVALDRLLQHTRRGCLHILWETALAEANACLARCIDVPAGDSLLQLFFWLCYEGECLMLGEPSALRPEARHHCCHQQRDHHVSHILDMLSWHDQVPRQTLQSAARRALWTQWRRWWSTSGAAGWMIMHRSLPSVVACAKWSSQALRVLVKVGVINSAPCLSAAPSHICPLLSELLHTGHSDDITCWHAAAIALFGPRPASTGVLRGHGYAISLG